MSDRPMTPRRIWRCLRARVSRVWRSCAACANATRSYAQYGEDTLLRAVFARYPSSYKGFYVDIGAHHPMRFSNTRLFYEQGWSGICVDPLPGLAKEFARWRSRDRFVQVGVAAEEGEMVYHMFDESAMNTCSERVATQCVLPLVDRQHVKVMPCSRLLAQYLPPGRTIDILSVDVEGMDAEVLRSNDWSRYRPRVVVAEVMTSAAIIDVLATEIVRFMAEQRYVVFARVPSAVAFMDTLSPAFDSSGFLRFVAPN